MRAITIERSKPREKEREVERRERAMKTNVYKQCGSDGEMRTPERRVHVDPRPEAHADVNDNVTGTAERRGYQLTYCGSVEVEEARLAGRWRKYRSKRSLLEEAVAKLKVRPHHRSYALRCLYSRRSASPDRVAERADR